MNEDEFFLISNTVVNYAEFIIGKCDICHLLPSHYVIAYTNHEKTGILMVCPKCYDKMDFQALQLNKETEDLVIHETEPEPTTSIPPRKNQAPEPEASDTINIIENESEKAITLEKDDTVEQVRKKETWLTRFIQAAIQNQPDPFQIIQDADVLNDDEILETIKTLGSVISYPFPTARKQAVTALGRILSLPTIGEEAKELALKNLMYFERDKDKSIQKQAKDLRKKYK